MTLGEPFDEGVTTVPSVLAQLHPADRETLLDHHVQVGQFALALRRMMSRRSSATRRNRITAGGSTTRLTIDSCHDSATGHRDFRLLWR